MAILSIQSHVVYGHAGNSAAVFPLQRLGHEVWAINTVEFSNHTGYKAWTGKALPPELANELVEGLAARGVLPQTEAVLSGYMGDAGTGNAILDAVARVKAASPSALYCCDPVMGDVGRGFYVKSGIPEMFKEKIIPAADIVTPNQFELEAITGLDTSSEEAAARAIARLHDMGPRVVLVTSFKTAEHSGEARIDMLASADCTATGGGAIFRISTPELPFPPGMAGSGDLTTALFLSGLLKTGSVQSALESAAASVYGVMEATRRANSAELLIIVAQEEIARPSHSFKAYRI